MNLNCSFTEATLPTASTTLRVPTVILPGTPIGNYLSVHGDCPGHDLGGYNMTLEQCSSYCDARPKCIGFVIVSKELKPHFPCWHKFKVCQTPVAAYGVLTYYVNSKSLLLCFIMNVNIWKICILLK